MLVHDGDRARLPWAEALVVGALVAGALVTDAPVTCRRRRAAVFFWAALFHWPDFLAHFLKKLNAAERPMFLFSTLFSQILSFSSRGADFLKKCVLSCGSLLCG